MPFNVKDWEKLSEDQLVPLCKPSDVLIDEKQISYEYYTFNGSNFTERSDYIEAKKSTLKLCWEYFVAGYQCYCLSKEAWRSERDYLLSLEKFQFSFKDLKNPEHKTQIFELNTNCELYSMEPGYDYVCDRTGFALIYYSDETLQFYYYDFKRKFTTYISIPFHENKVIIVKLYNRTLWIEPQRVIKDFHAVIIKGSNIWYSVKSKISCCYTMMNHVKSNSTFVYINKTPFLLLYINIDFNSLVSNRTKYVPFDEVPETTELAVLKTSLAENTYGTAIVDLSEKSRVLCMYFPGGILHFLYFESKQVISVKRLELGQRLKTLNKSGPPSCYFIPELAIMVAPTIKNTLVIINLNECKVSRMFDLEIVHFDEWRFLFSCSENFQKLTVTCSSYVPSRRKVILAFDLCNDLLSLKTLAIRLIKKHYSINDIRKLRLPQSLKTEILNGINY